MNCRVTVRAVRGDEERVVTAFVAWLEPDGWNVDREVDFCDVVARRGNETLYAEAKGRTAAIGLDVDTLYGQLLRRVPLDATGARFGAVVPSAARIAALRVSGSVRRMLDVTIYVVDDSGGVEAITPSPTVGESLPGATTDAFGVPFHLLGPHPEEVWGAIGRTIAIGALIENRLTVLLQMLTGMGQDAHAKAWPADAVKDLRDLAPAADPTWSGWSEWLARVERSVQWRNDLAHNLWPAQAGDRLFGWRLGRDGKLILTESTRGELMDHLVEAAVIAQESQRWVALAGAISGERLDVRRKKDAAAEEGKP